MGLYATTTTISVKLPNVMIDDTTSSDPKFTATFSRYIDKGESMFNAVASKRYSLPFTVVPPMAREISFELAAWYTIRAFSTRDWPNRNEMLDDYSRAFEDLKLIGSGEMRLSLTDGSLLAPLTGLILSNRSGEGATFDVDNEMNWKVDKDRLDDLEGSRD